MEKGRAKGEIRKNFSKKDESDYHPQNK